MLRIHYLYQFIPYFLEEKNKKYQIIFIDETPFYHNNQGHVMGWGPVGKPLI